MNQSDIESLLPENFRRTLVPGSPLSALLQVMEDLHAPVERALANPAGLLSAYEAPVPFVFLLAGFMDIERFLPQGRATERSPAAPIEPSPGIGRLREWIRGAPEMSRWRGTARGLTLMLETATGLQPYRVLENVLDETGLPRPFHIRIVAPAGALPHRSLIDAILEQEKPVFVTHELCFESA